MDDQCDYCYEGRATQVRCIGTDELEGTRVPVVKIWCGNCNPGDEVDPPASLMFLMLFRERD